MTQTPVQTETPVQIVRADQLEDEALRLGLCAGFCDYAVPMAPDAEMFAFMMRQRGLIKSVSAAAVADGRVIGVWLVSHEGPAAYLISSAIAPAFRGRGIARRMADAARTELVHAGARRFQTEVMADNLVAQALYQRLGMKVSRALTCYELTGDHLTPAPAGVAPCDWSEIMHEAASCRDWAPTWQNSDAAVSRAADQALCVALRDEAGLAGYAVGFRPNATVAQVAVRADQRRRGMGRRLVQTLARALGTARLRVINADSSDIGFDAFIQRLGGRSNVRQLELSASLVVRP